MTTTIITNKPIPTIIDIPRNQPIVGENGYLTDQWLLFFDQLIKNLQVTIKPEGIVIPPQTAANITALTGIQSYNNIVYDTTNNVFKGNQNGTWKTFTTT